MYENLSGFDRIAVLYEHCPDGSAFLVLNRFDIAVDHKCARGDHRSLKMNGGRQAS